MLEPLFYFAVTVLVLGAIFGTYEKVRRWRRAMRVSGWLALVGLHAVVIWEVGRLALLRLDLPAAAAWLGAEPPAYYRAAVIFSALLPISSLLVIAGVCARRAMSEIQKTKSSGQGSQPPAPHRRA
jgi:hypothetical protein